MQQEATFLPPPAPVWTHVSPPDPAPDAGTPIYDALARSWQEQGRQLPRPRETRPGAGRPEPLRPQAGTYVRTSNWRADTTTQD